METKWYSDFWRLFVSPFSGGIDQVVQLGGRVFFTFDGGGGHIWWVVCGGPHVYKQHNA